MFHSFKWHLFFCLTESEQMVLYSDDPQRGDQSVRLGSYQHSRTCSIVAVLMFVCSCPCFDCVDLCLRVHDTTACMVCCSFVAHPMLLAVMCECVVVLC